MQHALRRLMSVSDNAAFAPDCAPRHTRHSLAVHTVHVVGTHTPLLSNAKETADRMLQLTCHAGSSDLHQVRNMETGTRRGKEL